MMGPSTELHPRWPLLVSPPQKADGRETILLYWYGGQNAFNLSRLSRTPLE